MVIRQAALRVKITAGMIVPSGEDVGITNVERQTERMRVVDVWDLSAWYPHPGSPRVVLSGGGHRLFLHLSDFDKMDVRPEEGMSFDLTWEQGVDERHQTWVRLLGIGNVLSS